MQVERTWRVRCQLNGTTARIPCARTTCERAAGAAPEAKPIEKASARQTRIRRTSLVRLNGAHASTEPLREKR
jgi:hypothetical protein